MEDFNKAILILPDCVAAYTGRGLTYEKLGNLAKAKADFEYALSLSADLDAGLARPARALARERLAALAAEEAKRAKEAAERTAKEAAAKEATGTLAKVEAAKLVPEDIQQLFSFFACVTAASHAHVVLRAKALGDRFCGATVYCAHALKLNMTCAILHQFC